MRPTTNIAVPCLRMNDPPFYLNASLPILEYKNGRAWRDAAIKQQSI